MSFLWLAILGLMMGAVFGIALEKSRMLEPGVLIRQFQFKNFTMLKMFMTAVATGLVVLAALTGLGLAELHPKAAIMGSTIIGGLLLGAGIVVAGACPGTALAQIGAGYRDAWGIVAGGIAGAMFYGYNKGWIDSLVKFGDQGKLTLMDLTGLPFWPMALGLAALILAALYALEKVRPWQDDMAGLPGIEDDRATGESGAGKVVAAG
ncbi:MAG: YeeE/YedE thiosulfate transporter family protein [Pseudomonadota bacterium]